MGRLKQRTDAISGETVTYLYDTLGRLSSATATGVAWSQSFVHDGFGNLTQRTGSGTPLSVTVNEKNQITSGGASYDLNGNLLSINGHTLGYDIDNRLAAAHNVYIDAMPEIAGYGTEVYGNSVMGQRIYVERSIFNGWNQRELRMYGPDGAIIGEYIMKPATSNPYEEVFYPVEKLEKRRVYFAGRLVKFGTKAVVTDRLGSMIATRDTGTNQIARYRYYPYGEAIGTQEWDKPQFATYTRDGATGLDDAMNRQYDRIWGRFTTPDPYQASAGPADPGSWNRYSYVSGDPANKVDPLGLYDVVSWDGIDLRGMGNVEISGLDCNTRVFFGFMSIARCAAGSALGYSSAARGAPPSAPANRPVYLLVVGDCLDSNLPVPGHDPIRRRQYQLLDRDFQPLTGQRVVEQLSEVSPAGSIRSGNGWVTDRFGTFYDFYTNGTNATASSAIQEYFAIGELGSKAPLQVLEPDGGARVAGFPAYAKLGVYYSSSGVKINDYWLNPFVNIDLNSTKRGAPCDAPHLYH